MRLAALDRLSLLACVIAASLVACDAATTPPARDSGVPRDAYVPPAGDDTDGDSISDDDEGAADAVDSDDDGTPDYQDADSDNDGVPDAIEAGDANLVSPPRDADSDGTPDFRDTDSDGNGIPDATESDGDADDDGVPDRADLDDDDDYINDVMELDGSPATPPDADSDGTPDLRDTDSDGDTIADRDEGTSDTDEDGTPDRLDLDSDDDTLPDAQEAGDTNVATAPVDSDLDGAPDYRDMDSDDDGLTDGVEVMLGTNPTDADSDHDGVTDLVEYAAGTDPLDPSESPRSVGDFVFVMPYEAPPMPERDTLLFRTAIRAADIYFAFDTSTTMIAEMDALRHPTTGVPGIIDRLLCDESATLCAGESDCAAGQVCNPRGRCATDPSVDGCLLDLHTGIGRWDHVDSYRNLRSIQGDPALTAAAIPPSAPDWWVAPIQAPACVANPSNCSNTDIACATSGVGCPGFRTDAIRIYVQITDAADECLCGFGTNFPCDTADGPAARCAMFTPAFAGAELASAGIRFIGLIGDGPAYGTGDATAIARGIGTASGTVDMSGEPFVYAATDGMVVNRTVEAVRAIVTESQFDITIDAADEPGDAGDSLQFIDRLEVNTTGPGCAGVVTTDDRDGDGYDDMFTNVNPGIRVCWDVVALRNDTVPETRMPQVFRARLTVRADGSEVDARTIYFLVPADLTLPPVID